MTLTKQQITKRCKTFGIILVEVNACYSSFIGNIQHDFTDPINAAVEIGRRGLFKYKKNMFYPYKTIKDTDTLYSLFGEFSPNRNDALYKTETSWDKAYKTSQNLFKLKKDFENRWRLTIDRVSKPYQ